MDNKNIFIIVAVLLVVVGGGYWLLKGQNSIPNKTQNPTVEYSGQGFSPNSITVKSGTAVTWINNSGSGLSVNSIPHPVHTNYSPLNIGAIGNGESKSLIFDKPGTYGYHNHLVPSETGEVIVE